MVKYKIRLNLSDSLENDEIVLDLLSERNHLGHGNGCEIIFFVVIHPYFSSPGIEELFETIHLQKQEKKVGFEQTFGCCGQKYFRFHLEKSRGAVCETRGRLDCKG